MSVMRHKSGIQKLSLAGIIVTMGIVFGDIGTSPLYVMKAILSEAEVINELLIYGALSAIFWTLTLQTTVKYVIITLRADNHGEGGIFALFALLRRKAGWATILTMIGGSTLLADGIITPAITVTSSIEGLKLLNPDISVVPLVLVILTAIFFIQQFGTKLIGNAFGPVMLLWFSVLLIMGLSQLMQFPTILQAINPMYAYHFIFEYPEAIVLLGAVFLCTTGAEALYSDLGHCGIRNIRISWIYVKIALLINYFGQGAWILNNLNNLNDANPFYAIMPIWFLPFGIFIATSAAIIASQSLISGSFTLISEAVSLNLWPNIKISYPTNVKGQVYIPFVNWFLWVMCCIVVLFFQESSNMEAAYGLSITITMLMTTFILTKYLHSRKVKSYILIPMVMLFGTIESTFLFANLHKFENGGWVTILISSLLFLIMYGWYFGRKIKNEYISFEKIEQKLELFKSLSADISVPKIATNLVYIIKANRIAEIESKILYSIFNKHPKRADIYWFLHVDSLDEPNTFEYSVHHLIPGKLIRVDFRLGFKIERRINLYFRQVVEDLEKQGEISTISHYESLKKHAIPADFLFVNLERIMTHDYKLSPGKNFTMSLYNFIRNLGINDVKSLNLDTSNVIEEKVPIVIAQVIDKRIERAI